jgi:hypothetical protein
MAQPSFSDEELVTGYLRSIAEGGGDTPHFWAWEEVTELVGTDPERAWRLTLEMVRQSRDDLALAAVAAGPLEDLLAWFGTQFVERVENLAATEPRFQQALKMIYASRLQQDVRGRVERAIKGNA